MLLLIGSAAKFDVTDADGVASATDPPLGGAGRDASHALVRGRRRVRAVRRLGAVHRCQGPGLVVGLHRAGRRRDRGRRDRRHDDADGDLGGKAAPLLQQTVTFTLTGPASKTYSTITDYLGRATLPATGLAAGTYSVTARYAGDSTFTADTRTGTLVVSPFTGFLQPVDNPPTVNTVKAGSAVPIKFSLGGNRGLAILAPGSPVVTAVSCASGAPLDEIETTVATSNSGLQYDAGSNTYTFVWKTPSSFAGSCRRLDLRLVDGTSHVALFRLR